MLNITRNPIPTDALLRSYVKDGYYADCYTTIVDGKVSHESFVVAFYTSALFKIERRILSALLRIPSNDQEARQLASGTLEEFSAWKVEARHPNQLLVADFRGRTRSWLMTRPLHDDARESTQLYFGSAVVPERSSKTGELALGPVFYALLGFHKVYSILLLYAAKKRIKKSISFGRG